MIHLKLYREPPPPRPSPPTRCVEETGLGLIRTAHLDPAKAEYTVWEVDLLFFFFFNSDFKLFILYWRIADEQCCSFRGTAKGLSHRYTYLFSLPPRSALDLALLGATQAPLSLGTSQAAKTERQTQLSTY